MFLNVDDHPNGLFLNMVFYLWTTSNAHAYMDLAEIKYWIVLLCLTASIVPDSDCRKSTVHSLSLIVHSVIEKVKENIRFHL